MGSTPPNDKDTPPGTGGSDRTRTSLSSSGALEGDEFLKGLHPDDGPLVVGPVKLQARVSRGGMGVVYRGRHLKLDIDVAVKFLFPHLAENNPEYIVRFEREARMAAKLNNENLVRVFDVDSEKNYHYVVMEFVCGETARERTIRKGPLPEAEALEIIVGATRGLVAAHRNGIVHRDIKPDNIMIDASGIVKLADLGIAKTVHDAGTDAELTQPGFVMGTPSFMPPEQLHDARSVGFPGDIYSMGATLYYLLTGKAPFAGSIYEIFQKVSKEEFPDIRKERPGISRQAVEILECCTRRDPLRRYPDAQRLLEALERTGAGRGSLADEGTGTVTAVAKVSTPPARRLGEIRMEVEGDGEGGTDAPAPARRRRARLGTVAIAAGAVALAACAAGWLLLTGPGPEPDRAGPGEAAGGKVTSPGPSTGPSTGPPTGPAPEPPAVEPAPAAVAKAPETPPDVPAVPKPAPDRWAPLRAKAEAAIGRARELAAEGRFEDGRNAIFPLGLEARDAPAILASLQAALDDIRRLEKEAAARKPPTEPARAEAPGAASSAAADEAREADRLLKRARQLADQGDVIATSGALSILDARADWKEREGEAFAIRVRALLRARPTREAEALRAYAGRCASGPWTEGSACALAYREILEHGATLPNPRSGLAEWEARLAFWSSAPEAPEAEPSLQARRKKAGLELHGGFLVFLADRTERAVEARDASKAREAIQRAIRLMDEQGLRGELPEAAARVGVLEKRVTELESAGKPSPPGS